MSYYPKDYLKNELIAYASIVVHSYIRVHLSSISGEVPACTKYVPAGSSTGVGQGFVTGRGAISLLVGLTGCMAAC